jgi:deoxyribose-phosphate aldolase
MNTAIIIRSLDVAVLKPTDTLKYALATAEAGKKLGFASVCVRPDHVKEVAQLLCAQSLCKVGTVIGFPLGYGPTINKVHEAEEALCNDATEFDMVMNLSEFKAQHYDMVVNEIHTVRKVLCHPRYTLKVILETCLLTPEEIAIACQLAKDAGADHVKTSTGFSTGGATIAAVKIMLDTVSGRIGVKASGGIKSREVAEGFLALGCSRLGVGAGSYAQVIREPE